MKFITSACAALLLGALLTAAPADAGINKPVWTNHTNGKTCPTKNNTNRVPEPSTLILLGAGLTGLAVTRLRKQ